MLNGEAHHGNNRNNELRIFAVNLIFKESMTRYKPDYTKDSRNRAVPNRAPAQYSASKRWRVLIALFVIAIFVANNGCSFSPKPSKLVEDLGRSLERAETEKALTFFSSRLITRRGIGPLKEDLERTAAELKQHGGIKSIKVLSEDEAGDLAEVLVEITRGNGVVTKARYKFVKEQGAWKIDDVSLETPSQSVEPLHPEGAVEDVVKWARDTGAAKLKNWLEKQSPPAICKAPTVDRTTLPDEVRYQDVDDPQVKERLLSALDPVLKLIACSNKQGIVLYKGQNVYAGNLEGGQIAITPGELYFVGSPPDESIFHELAKLRIFLAREIFRQMVPTEPPTAAFNEADMILRRDLKLNYLAGLVSLTIDKDSTILDRVALDIASYAKPVGIVSGTQGTPSLRQIKDVFGAAKENY